MLTEGGNELLMAGLATETIQGIEHRKIGLFGAIMFDALSFRYPILRVGVERFKERLDERRFPNSGFSSDKDSASFPLEDGM
jgi:hypothetical protein